MKHMIITTANEIEGAEIAQYLDLVRVNTVVSSDLSLSNLFSGAGRYNDTINDVFNKATIMLRLKGRTLNADAIIGVQSDLEQVSSRSKQRFVVTLVGTAVQLHWTNGSRKETTDEVSMAELKQSLLTLQLGKKLEDSTFLPDEEDWENIMTYSLYDLAPALYQRYLQEHKEIISSSTMSQGILLNNNFLPLIQSMGYEQACQVVYSDLTTAPYCTRDVVRECHLFHPGRIVQLLEPKNKHLIISLLECDKPHYTRDDLKQMRQIEHFLDTLPDTGHYEQAKTLRSSKKNIVLVCERGHSSAVELGGHCTEVIERGMGVCNLNVKGITASEVEAINSFKQKISVLQSLIENRE